MRILFIASSYPDSAYSTGGPRLFYLCRELSKRHTLGLVVFGADTQDVLDNDSIFDQVTFISPPPPPGFVRRQLHRLSLSAYISQKIRDPLYLKDVVRKIAQLAKNYDVAIVQNLEVAQYCGELCCPRIYDLLDCSSNLFHQFSRSESGIKNRAKFLIESFAIANEERKLLRSKYPIVAIGERDKECYSRIYSEGTIYVIPNGVDCDYFGSAENYSRDRNKVIFTGTMSYLPNIEAADFFVSKILPEVTKNNPNAVFYIVGKDPSARVLELAANDHVKVTGTVKDIRPYLFSAAVFVAPIFSGSGMKNKILEAMASEIPIIATAESMVGIKAFPGEHYIEANSAEEFVAELLRFDGESDAVKSMTRNSKKLVSENYSWQITAKLFEELFEKLL